MPPLRWKLSNKCTLPIGLDIGASGVKALQLRSTPRGYEVVAASAAPIERSATGPLPEPGAIEQAIRLVLKAGAFRGRECVCALPPSALMLRAVRLPSMADEELDKAAVWEASDRFGMPPEQLQVDWIRAGTVTQADEVREEIVLVAVPRTVSETCVDAVMRAGLRPLACDASFAAVARALTRSLRRQTDSSVVRMLIDVGTDGTSVMFTQGRGLTFVKYIALGGAKLQEAVAAALKLAPDAAAHLRQARLRGVDSGGEVVDRRVEQAVFEAQRPLLHDLANEAALCQRYHGVTFRTGRPECVLLTGGNANEPHLVQALSEALKAEVVIANPLEQVDISTSASALDRRTTDWNRWTAALGLSLRAEEAPRTQAGSAGNTPTTGAAAPRKEAA